MMQFVTKRKIYALLILCKKNIENYSRRLLKKLFLAVVLDTTISNSIVHKH